MAVQENGNSRFTETDFFRAFISGEIQYLLAEFDNLEDHEKFLNAAEKWVYEAEVNILSDESNDEPIIAEAHAFFGEAFDTQDEIFKHAQELMVINKLSPDITDEREGAGFDKLRQMSVGLSDEQYRLVQRMVIRDLATQAMEKQKISADEVDLVLVATSIPIHSKFGEEWRAAAGVSDDVEVIPYCMACNSSGRAIADLQTGVFDELVLPRIKEKRAGKPANILLIALDDANREGDKGGKEGLSAQFFSTAAAILLWKYHPDGTGSLKTLVSNSESIATDTKYLQVRRPYDTWDDEDVLKKLRIAQHLQAPDHSGPVNLHEKASGAFLRYGFRLAQATLEEFEGEISDIKRVVVHHPGKKVFLKMKKKFMDKGFTDEQIQWVIPEGNVPVATIVMALGRQLKVFKTGDKIMILSFGAGGEYTCSIFEIGGIDLNTLTLIWRWIKDNLLNKEIFSRKKAVS